MCWHKWSKWKPYGVLIKNVDQDKAIPVHVSKIQLRQRRDCVKCGKLQDQSVAYTNNLEDIKEK